MPNTTRSGAARKQARKYAWRGILSYGKRIKDTDKLGGHVKDWTQAELDEYRSAKPKKGKNTLFRKIDRKIKKLEDFVTQTLSAFDDREEEDTSQNP